MNARRLVDDEALLAEELPTGLFGGPPPALPYTAAVDPRAAEHVAELKAALDAHDAYVRRGHLRLVVDAERAAS